MISGGRTEQLDIIAGLLPHHWLYECYSSIPLSPPIRPTCPAFQVTCLGLPTSWADKFIQEEGSTTYTDTHPISGSIAKLINWPHPVNMHWASSWGRPKCWCVKGARIVPYSEPWNSTVLCGVVLLMWQANAVQYRLIVRQVTTLQITQLYTCLDAIQHVEVTALTHAAAPCGLRGCKHRPALFPGRMSYKTTKSGSVFCPLS